MLRRQFIGTGALAASAHAAGLRVPSAANCIILVMSGGVSQLDTFDPKPEAPSDVRGNFRAIRTAASEIRISELFPRLAQQARKFSLIRSMHYPGGDLLHDEGLELALTGEVGAGDLPRFPALPPTDLPRPTEAYGRSTFGAHCLAARMAVERGTRMVLVPMYSPLAAPTGWDMHGYSPFSSFATYRELVAPMFDLAASALLQELDERGLLATTLVVGITEFGRTPKINPTGGRDHWTKCWTTMIAGGGIEGGQVLGTSDAYGAEPRDNPMTPNGLLELIAERTGAKPQFVPSTAT